MDPRVKPEDDRLFYWPEDNRQEGLQGL